MANGIIDRTEERFDQQPTFTDKFPFIKLGGRSIAHDFQEQGLTLTLGELDRKNRAAMTISKLNGEKLLADSEEKWPMMLFFQSCKYCRDYIPMVERHENEAKQWDYAESGEATHIVDCVTLAAVAHKIIHDAPVTDKSRVDNSLNHPKNTKKSIKDIIPELNL